MSGANVRICAQGVHRCLDLPGLLVARAGRKRPSRRGPGCNRTAASAGVDQRLHTFGWFNRSATVAFLHLPDAGPARSGSQNLQRTGTVRSASGKNMAGANPAARPIGNARIESAARPVCGDDRGAAGFKHLHDQSLVPNDALPDGTPVTPKGGRGTGSAQSARQGAGLALDEQPGPFTEVARSSPEGLTGSGAAPTSGEPGAGGRFRSTIGSASASPGSVATWRSGTASACSGRTWRGVVPAGECRCRPP